MGELVGYILEPVEGYYDVEEDIKCVEASIWMVSSSGQFSITAYIEPLLYKSDGSTQLLFGRM